MTIKQIGELWNLKPWSGTTPESSIVYPTNKSSHPLFTDSGGNIYYLSIDGNMLIWCPRCRLRGHLNRLFQMGVI